jgi:HlyD family secretion protein
MLSGCEKYDQNAVYGYIEGRFTYISSQMTGTLESIAVERGTPITKNQALATLEYNPEQAEYDEAKASLEKAKWELVNAEKGARPSEIAAYEAQQRQYEAQIIYAAKTVKRYQHLVATNALDQSSLDEEVATYNKLNAQLAEVTENLITAKLPERIDKIRAAKAEVVRAQATVAQYKWKLEQKSLFAPVSGRVYDTYFRIGEVVPADQPILSMLAPENVYVVFFIPEPQMASLKIGQKISFTCDGCAKPIFANIYFISDKAEYAPPVIYSETTRADLVFRVEAKLSINDAKQMHPGQPITINLSPTGTSNGNK